MRYESTESNIIFQQFPFGEDFVTGTISREWIDIAAGCLNEIIPRAQFVLQNCAEMLLQYN